MYSSDDKAVCRGCGKVLRGKPYRAGGRAYDPITDKPCPPNYFGGFVCSRSCDFRASLEQEQSMPGHGHGQQRLTGAAQQAIERNWSTNDR